MRKAIDLFNKILDDTNNAKIIYSYLDNVVHPPFDYSDLLRWQWAQAVSAFDKLIHDLVRAGMVSIFLHRRNPTHKFLSFTLDTNTHIKMVQNPITAHIIFEQQIILKNGFLSFQDPNKVSDALAYIWDEPNKWSIIASALALDEKDVKTELKNIVIRRNQIVHEGDYSDTILDRQKISDKDVNDVMVFVRNLGNAIYNLVK